MIETLIYFFCFRFLECLLQPRFFLRGHMASTRGLGGKYCLRGTLLCSFFRDHMAIYFCGHLGQHTSCRSKAMRSRHIALLLLKKSRARVAGTRGVEGESNTLEAHCSTLFFNTLEAHCSPLFLVFFSRSCGRHKRCRRKAIPSRTIALLCFSNYFRVGKKQCPPDRLLPLLMKSSRPRGLHAPTPIY